MTNCDELAVESLRLDFFTSYTLDFASKWVNQHFKTLQTIIVGLKQNNYIPRQCETLPGDALAWEMWSGSAASLGNIFFSGCRSATFHTHRDKRTSNILSSDSSKCLWDVNSSRLRDVWLVVAWVDGWKTRKTAELLFQARLSHIIIIRLGLD